jgi:hypothetical protein
MSFRVRDTSTITFKEVEHTKEVIKEMKKIRKKSIKKSRKNETVNTPQSSCLRMKVDFTSMSDYF